MRPRLHGGRRYLPIAFTEHGALMAANILNSPRAVAMSVYVIRAFVKMREDQVANTAVLKRLAEIDKTLLIHDSALRDIFRTPSPPGTAPPQSSPESASTSKKTSCPTASEQRGADVKRLSTGKCERIVPGTVCRCYGQGGSALNPRNWRSF